MREALNDNAFWLLTAGFVIHAAAISTVSVLLVSRLQHAGHTLTVAATRQQI